MIARPKRYEFSPDQPLKVQSGDDGGVFIQCDVTQPKSMEGRSITVYVQPEDVVKLMQSCRRAAIKARSKTLAESER